MTDDTDHSYLARVSRDLRGDVPERDEVRVEHLAHLEVGRRAISLHISSSEKHGVCLRLGVMAPPPPNGGHRLHQEAHLYLRELDALLEALTTARARLAAAPPRPRTPKGPRR
jgi:hypothetical protein